MPRFYFDTDDGERAFRDRAGVELADLAAAKDEAMGLLQDLSQAGFGAEGRRSVRATVRDTTGAPVYAATLTLTLDSLTA